MSDKDKKRKKRKFAQKQEQRQRQRKRLVDEGRYVGGTDIPQGAVAADPSQQVPNNSYSPPPLFYVDKDFNCVDCGSKETWTARQQKLYYEVAKGSLYATAVRCAACRRIHAEQRLGQGDPNPIKHIGSLMKHIRSNIEPELFKKGFQLEGRHAGSASTTAWLDYVRPGLSLRCLFDPRQAKLIAETIDDASHCQTIAANELPILHSTPELLQLVDKFTLAVSNYVQSLA